jgi:hypothetical protein
MPRLLSRLLTALGVEPRSFAALTKALILMDLRGRHYGRATATKPNYLISPLFWVVGQCQAISALTSLLLFARVDVFFFAFANISVSMLVIASTILVEFNEVVFDPRDQEIVGQRPIAPRTYAAARFANLLFYIILMYLALNLMPLLVGAGLRDAGAWYAPAYLIASLASNLIVAALVILGLSLAGSSARLERWKEILAWTQIALVFVLFYGGQLVLRQGDHSIQVWGAFPPAWIQWLPSSGLARFVEEAAVAPTASTLVTGLLLAAGGLAACTVTVWRLGRLYRTMEPATITQRVRPMPADHLGTVTDRLGRWVTRGREEQIGFWLCRTLLQRDIGLRIRCIWCLNLAVAAVLLGVFSGQFANPRSESELRLVMLSILSVYLLALAVPAIVYQMTFTREGAGWWLLAAAPVERPALLARGACKAMMVLVVFPLCLLWAIVAAVMWRDPLAALLHAALAGLLCWTMALTSLWLVLHDPPFALPLARGSAVGPLAIPVAILAGALTPLATLHYYFAGSLWFWIAVPLLCLATWWPLGRQAEARIAHLWRADR